MHLTGEGVIKDYTRAAEWYSKAANQGDAKAQYNLGVMHYKGQGAKKDGDMAKSISDNLVIMDINQAVIIIRY